MPPHGSRPEGVIQGEPKGGGRACIQVGRAVIERSSRQFPDLGTPPAREQVLVETFVAQVTVEAFDVGILDGFAGTNEIEPYVMCIGPGVHRAAYKLSTIVDRDRLAELVKEKPDATLVELRDRLGISVTPWAICKALRELELTYKKSRSAPPSRTGRTSPRNARS